MPHIELNEHFLKALDMLEKSRENVFITGKAGTGKSTLLDYFRRQTPKKVAVLAPTGVAALNVLGETIHSFFRFKPDITLKKIKKLSFRSKAKNLYLGIEMIVIDEISMVRADLLDCIDRFLRFNGPKQNKPFGGIQMVFIGDLYQLPPVVASQEKNIFKEHYPSPYFFDARSFPLLNMRYLELEKIYRQKDNLFIKFLNGVRNNSVTEEDLGFINTRVNPAFDGRGEGFSAGPDIEDAASFVITSNANLFAIIKLSNQRKGKEYGRACYQRSPRKDEKETGGDESEAFQNFKDHRGSP